MLAAMQTSPALSTEPVRNEDVPSADHMAEEELVFWNGIFDRRAAKGDGYVDFLLDPAAPLQKEFEALIAGSQVPDNHVVKVLDVGSGPLSVLGKKAPNFALD